jgi:hypothetical protein
MSDCESWTNIPHQSKFQQSVVKKDSIEHKTSISTRWEKGKCFKCQEPWVPSHNNVCKFRNQINLISIEDEDKPEQEVADTSDNNEEQDEGSKLQISMHALPETCSKAQTFPLFVQMGDVKMVALIDSGSTTTFLDPSVIEKLGISVSHNKPKKVSVANGGIL